jgi:predicted Zn-dependent protease
MHAFAVFAVAALVFPEASPFPPALDAIFDKAYHQRTVGDLHGAEQLLGEVTRAAPGNPRGWNLLGQVYLDEQRDTDADAALSRAITLGLDTVRLPETLALRAVARMRLGRLDDAAADARVALGRDPHQPKALLVTAAVEAHAGHAKKARDILERLVREQPDFATAHELLAAVLADIGDVVGAEKQLKLARSLGSKEPSLDELQRALEERKRPWRPYVLPAGILMLLGLGAWFVRRRRAS